MKQTYRVLLILYRDFIAYNLIFTFVGGYLVYFYRELSFPFVFWIKVLGFTALVFGYYQTRRHRLFFYHNLGFTLKRLVFYAFAIDFTIALFLLSAVYGIA